MREKISGDSDLTHDLGFAVHACMQSNDQVETEIRAFLAPFPIVVNIRRIITSKRENVVELLKDAEKRWLCTWFMNTLYYIHEKRIFDIIVELKLDGYFSKAVMLFSSKVKFQHICHRDEKTEYFW